MNSDSLFLELASVSSRVKLSLNPQTLAQHCNFSLHGFALDSSALFNPSVNQLLLSSNSYRFFIDLTSSRFYTDFYDSHSLTEYFNNQILQSLRLEFPSFPKFSSFCVDTTEISKNLSSSCFEILSINSNFSQETKLNRAHLYCYRIAVLLAQRIDELKLLLSDFLDHYLELKKFINFTQVILFDGLGDPHNNCRSVMKLQQANTNQFVFYKPRFCDGEKLWDLIKSKLGKSFYHSSNIFRIEANFGFFEEAVSYQSVQESLWPELYQKLGFDLFIAHLTRHTDLWFDNLICTPDGLTFIDHENIYQPISKPYLRKYNLNGSERDPSLDLSLSVLMTMSLSQPMKMASTSIFQDMGCLSHLAVYRWPHLFDDSSTWEHSEHLPSSENKCMPIWFTSDIKTGYLDAHRCFLTNKDVVYKILLDFKSRTRVIRQSTFDYYDIQRQLYSNIECISGQQRWEFLVTAVSKSYASLDGDFNWNDDLALLSEVIQLDNGDIPYFYADFAETSLFDASLNNVGSFEFNIRSHLDNLLSPNYIDQQLNLISLSSNLHASISPSSSLLNTVNSSYQSHSVTLSIQDNLQSLFHKLSSYLNQFIAGNTLTPCINHSFESNCLFIGEPSHSGITGIASSLEAFLDLFFISPSLYTQSSISLVTSAFNFLDSFFQKISKNPSFHESISWSSLFYLSDLCILKAKYDFFLDCSSQLISGSYKLELFATHYLSLYQDSVFFSAFERLNHDIVDVKQNDLLSTEKLKYLRLKTFQFPIDEKSENLTDLFNDESLRHLLLLHVLDNDLSSRSLLTSQSLATASFAFDSGWKGWANFGVFIQFALLSKSLLNLDMIKTPKNI